MCIIKMLNTPLNNRNAIFLCVCVWIAKKHIFIIYVYICLLPMYKKKSNTFIMTKKRNNFELGL